MKAVVLYEYGDINQLKFVSNQQEPPFGSGEVRVRIRATSINPIDWKLRSGAARSRLPLTFPRSSDATLPVKSPMWAATSPDSRRACA